MGIPSLALLVLSGWGSTGLRLYTCYRAGFSVALPGPFCCRYNRRGRAPVACGSGASSTVRGGALVKRARAPYRVRRTPAFILEAGRGSCARKRRGVPADVAGAPYIRTQGLRPLYCPWPRCPLSHYHTTRPSPCAPSALRGTSGGATITIPGGAGTPYVRVS